MKLPVVKSGTGPSSETVWRQFTDLILDHALAAGVEVPTKVGRLVVGDTPLTRRIAGVAVVTADRPAGAFDELAKECDDLEVTLPQVLSATALPGSANVIFRETTGRLFRLTAAPPTPAPPPGVLVLPVRAGVAAYQRACAERFVDECDAVSLPRHLDDPQYDAAVVVRDGVLLGIAGLRIRGQSGLICDVWVCPHERRRGLARLLVGRMIDLAARAQLATVYAAATDDASTTLLEGVGFVSVATFRQYLPDTPS